jgi:hypothetical protein
MRRWGTCVGRSKASRRRRSRSRWCIRQRRLKMELRLFIIKTNYGTTKKIVAVCQNKSRTLKQP